jgi:hypothetical protein
MRSWTTLVLAVLLVLPAPALGQDPGAVKVLEDKAGDVVAEANGVGAPGGASGRYAATDLTGLSVQESLTEFTFALAVASLSSAGETLAETSVYRVDFAFQGTGYRIVLFRQVTTGPQYAGFLDVLDPGNGRYSFVEQLPVDVSAEANAMTVRVARDLLVDADGAAPYPGSALTGFHAYAIGLVDTTGGQLRFGPLGGVDLPPLRIFDAMPDSGNGTLDWAVRLGLAQTGNARLASLVPVRASNGEATTFVFAVKASNLGPAQRFRLSAAGAPATWQVGLPSDLVEIPAQSSVDLPILVSTPFAHQHGTLQQFTLELAGVDHPGDVGRLRLGVRYTQPPQPAGHHDTVFLHTAAGLADPVNTAFSAAAGFDSTSLYFNTLAPEDDEADVHTPVAGSLFDIDPPSITYTWTVPLSPGLQMGLDFDLSRQGLLRVPVDTVLPMMGAVLAGRIVYTDTSADACSGDDCTVDDFAFGPGRHLQAAAVGPSAPQDVPPNTKGAMFEAPVLPLPAGDYLPFRPGATLALQLNLTFTRVDGFVPNESPDVAGGEMVLPLLEYHDPVTQVFSSLGSLMIEVTGEQQRLVNPGGTALYELRLMNHGASDASYDLSLDGANLGWASILGDRRVSVPAGQERMLGIAVTAPSSAHDADASDLVLTAVDAKDPTARTLARLLTTVDTDAEHPDDASKVPGLDAQLHSKGSPGLEPLALAAALVALAFAARRRR